MRAGVPAAIPRHSGARPAEWGRASWCEAAAGEFRLNLLRVSAADVVKHGIWRRRTEYRICVLVGQRAPAVPALFDDFDAIANPHSVRVVNQLLISLERYWTAGGRIVVAAVNDLDLIDPALTPTRRFDHQISVDVAAGSLP